MANEKNPYKDMMGLTGYVMGNFPETMMDIEDAVGFGKIYESEIERRGNKSTKDIDEDYAGRKKKDKKVPIIKPDPKRKKIRVGRKNEPTKTERDSEFLDSLKKKKYGGKINYRMGGGQVVDSSYD